MSIVRSEPRVLAAKAAKRVWGTWSTVVAVCETEGHIDAAENGRVVVAPIARDEFEGFTRLMRAGQLDGEDYLFVRGLERTRRVGAGDLFGGYSVADGSLLATVWVHRASHSERLEGIAPGMYREPPPGTVLTDGLYCFPNARRQGLGTETLTGLLAQLEREGTRRAFAHIDSDNVASMSTFGRVGYRLCDVERRNAFRLGIWRSAWRPLQPETLLAWASCQRVPESGASAQVSSPVTCSELLAR